MGQRDNLPDPTTAQPAGGHPPAEAVLRHLTQDLQSLQRTLSAQFSQDLERMQGQKQRLMADIESLEADYERLRSRHHALQNSHEAALSQQQQLQQQLWAKRLAQLLATHLQANLSETLTGSAAGGAGLPHTQQVLASLDTTLHSTLQSLQQDLNSYQSSLSQQMGRMQSLEQQGEAILEALVNRLSQQLQVQLVPNPALSPHPNGYSALALPAPPRPALRPSGRSRACWSRAYGSGAQWSCQQRRVATAIPGQSSRAGQPVGEHQPAQPSGHCAAARADVYCVFDDCPIDS